MNAATFPLTSNGYSILKRLILMACNIIICNMYFYFFSIVFYYKISPRTLYYKMYNIYNVMIIGLRARINEVKLVIYTVSQT